MIKHATSLLFNLCFELFMSNTIKWSSNTYCFFHLNLVDLDSTEFVFKSTVEQEFVSILNILALKTQKCHPLTLEVYIDIQLQKIPKKMIAFSDDFVPFENFYLLAIGRGQSMFWNLCQIPTIIMYCNNKNMFKSYIHNVIFTFGFFRRTLALPQARDCKVLFSSPSSIDKI